MDDIIAFGGLGLAAFVGAFILGSVVVRLAIVLF